MRFKLPIIAQMFSIFLVASLLLAGVATYVYSLKSYEYQRNDLSVKIATASVRLGRALINPASQNDLESVRNIISAFAGTPEVVCVDLALRVGNVRESWPNKGCLTENPSLMMHDQPIRRGSRVVGSVQVFFTDEFIKKNIDVFIVYTFLGLSVVLFILLIIMLVAQRVLVTKPLNKIIRKMRKFKVGQVIDKDDSAKYASEFIQISTEFDILADKLNSQANEITNKNRLLKSQKQKIQDEKTKLEILIKNILPSNTVRELKETGTVQPKKYNNVGILVLDFIGFTKMSAKADQKLLFNELNEIFTCFDLLAELHCCERVKTIGDAYLAVANVNIKNNSQIESLAKFALEIIAVLEARKSPLEWKCRIGLHVGDIVAGVVGKTKILFDVFGDPLNTAFRTEGLSEPMKINCSKDFYSASDFHDHFEARGIFEVKGKESMEMFFLKSSYYHPNTQDITDIINSAKLSESLIEENFSIE